MDHAWAAARITSSSLGQPAGPTSSTPHYTTKIPFRDVLSGHCATAGAIFTFMGL